MNKIAIMVALAMLIPTCVAFVPTESDAKWATSVSDNAQIVSSDFNLIATAATNGDISSLRKYCENAKTDVSNALEDSEGYTVSNELQAAKDYYEQGLKEYYLATTSVISGIDNSNPSEISAGSEHAQNGNQQFQLAIKEINGLMGKS